MEENKNIEIVENTRIIARELEARVLGGEVIRDYTNEDGERILVTKTSNGKYGYAVYEKDAFEPHYIVEGEVLLEDLNKKTAYNGNPLRYPGAKSMIQRNMVGMFAEYIKDRGYEGFYVSLQMPPQATMDVSQQMSGYVEDDPVSIFSASFHDYKVSYAAFAQIIRDEKTNRPTLRIGLGGLNADGTPDYETTLKVAKEAEDAKRFLGEKAMDNSKIQEVAKESASRAQSVFYDEYTKLGLPMEEGIVPSNLLIDAMNGKNINGYLGISEDVINEIEGPKR